MKSEFYNPVKIEFGRHSLRFLPRFVSNRKALLVTTSGFVKRGLVDEVLSANPTICKVISNIQPNPTIIQVKELKEEIKSIAFDVIIALGGGSVIDVAKALAPVIEQDSLLEVLENGIPSDVEVKPIIAIPTTSGTGSEVTMWGTIWDDINKLKYSVMDERLYCESAILDPMLHLTIPANITIQTGLDALSHSFESIWNKNKNEVSTLYAKNAINEILEVLPLLVSDLSNVEYRERMLIASYHSGVAFSNTKTSIAHAISYYLTLQKDVPHGIAASILLSRIIKIYMEDTSIDHELNLELVSKVEDLFNKLNISTRLKDYNITERDLANIENSLHKISRAQNSIINSSILFSILNSELKSGE